MTSQLEQYAMEQKNLDFLEMAKIPSWTESEDKVKVGNAWVLIISFFAWCALRERLDQQLLVSAISGGGCSRSYETVTMRVVLPWEFFLEYPDLYHVQHKMDCLGGQMGHEMTPRDSVRHHAPSFRHSIPNCPLLFLVCHRVILISSASWQLCFAIVY